MVSRKIPVLKIFQMYILLIVVKPDFNETVLLFVFSVYNERLCLYLKVNFSELISTHLQGDKKQTIFVMGLIKLYKINFIKCLFYQYRSGVDFSSSLE